MVGVIMMFVSIKSCGLSEVLQEVCRVLINRVCVQL